MEYGFLDVIYEYYSNGELNSICRESTPEVRAFVEEYIEPALQKERKAGFEMEAMFNAALAESAKQEFIQGFQACMHFMIECM